MLAAPGLGAHAELGIPMIGVAKFPFRTATHAVPVRRGTTVRPLFVTAAGMARADAADLVRHMAGRYRLPDALRRADALAQALNPMGASAREPLRSAARSLTRCRQTRCRAA